MKSEITVSRKSQKFRSAFHFLEIKQKSGNVNIFKFNFCVSSLLLTWSFSLKRRSFQGFAARKGKFMMIDKGQKWQKNWRWKTYCSEHQTKDILVVCGQKELWNIEMTNTTLINIQSTPLLCAYQPPLAPPTLPRLERPGYKSVSYFSTQTG